MKNLRKRFVLFNMLVITCILLLFTLFVLIGDESRKFFGVEFIETALEGLLLVFIASLLISKYTLKPIQQSWQKQLDFTADASHELRTPLAVIRMNLELVMDNPDETVANQMHWLQNIATEQLRMSRLVDDLLMLSRTDADEQTLLKSEFLIDEMVLRILTSFQPVCCQKELTLESKIDSNITFYGDEARIAQLFTILIDNAVQYTSSGGHIYFELMQNQNEICIILKDTGVGISNEDTKRIFERFFRAEHSRNKNPEGSGLGLAIAQWIVKQHKGKEEQGKTVSTILSVLIIFAGIFCAIVMANYM